MLRIFALAFICLFAAKATALEKFEKSILSIETAKGVHKFEVELAVTPAQHSQGLMHRLNMAPKSGMLFVYSRPQPVSFWMKNTFIPLDMIFIAADGKIINIRQRTVPHSLIPVRSKANALAVLELNGGTASSLNIQPGDRVRHEVFAN